MLTKTNLKMFFVVILALSAVIAPKASAMKLTLSDEGLMAIDDYSRNISGLTATILEKRDIEGAGVEFDIYFPSNKRPDNAIYYYFSEQKRKEVFEGIDVNSYDAFELRFTLLSVDGNDSPDSGGSLNVGACINGAFRPKGISLNKGYSRSAVSTTKLGLTTSRNANVGFTAYIVTPQGWNPNGTIVTLLVEAEPNSVSLPRVKEDRKEDSEGGIIYVDSNAPGENDGSSWVDAFRYLQDGLAVAFEGDQIWVAGGIYRPDQGKNKRQGDRTVSFELKKGVMIYGGFPSGGGYWEERNRRVNKTILSGDLQGNDAKDIVPTKLSGDATRNDNSYRVVVASGTDYNTILGGFIITGGNAKGNSSSSYDKGGGLYCKSGSLTLLNCLFKGNSGIIGGAMYNSKGDPSLINCTFLLNSANDEGAGIYSSRGSPILYNCVFGSNYAKEHGGGMYNEFNSPIITNCTFSGNSAYAGGGIYCKKAKPIVTNSILWGNSSRYGKLEPSQIYASEASIDYSCIQGLTEDLAGKGNIGLDPHFLKAAENDFNLKADSPCIDAGTNDLLLPEINTDVDGTVRLKDGNNDDTARIDIGAQEF